MLPFDNARTPSLWKNKGTITSHITEDKNRTKNASPNHPKLHRFIRSPKGLVAAHLTEKLRTGAIGAMPISPITCSLQWVCWVCGRGRFHFTHARNAEL